MTPTGGTNSPSAAGLPVAGCVEDLIAALRENRAAILVAPPGAGKTTWLPLALLERFLPAGGKLLVVVPRRIAARSAARRMASLIAEEAGQTVGYRVRMESRVSARTRIEVITAGVFVRRITGDPELAGVSAILFDEFHERGLDADLGLALALDVRSALRPDLVILPMSATPDVEGLKRLMPDTPLIETTGRSHTVDIRHEAPPAGTRMPDHMASIIERTLRHETGSLLCFLPGVGEIRSVRRLLEDRLPATIHLLDLHGSLSPAEQDRAIAPPPPGERKVVLATAIAETSLTLEGVHVVIDSGWARQPRHEPGSGLTRLETVRVSKAAATQRAGRAGRTGPGIAIRLWHEGQWAALADHTPPEILAADLSGLVLQLANWGVSDPASLGWIDPPPQPAWQEARSILLEIGALGADGSLTPHGRKVAGLPLAPRLAHMVIAAARYGQAGEAASLALLIGERGLAGSGSDLSLRAERLARERDGRSRKASQVAASIAASAAAGIPDSGEMAREALSPGGLLSLAWPMRIARNIGRGGRGETLFRLAGGGQAFCEADDQMARDEWIVAAELQGSQRSARLIAGAPISFDEIERLHGDCFERRREIAMDEASGKVRVRETRRLGSLELGSHPASLQPGDRLGEMLVDWLRRRGQVSDLMPEEAAQFLARLRFISRHRPDTFAPLEESGLLENLEDWLLPFLAGRAELAGLSPRDWCQAIAAHAGGHAKAAWVLAEAERLAPQMLELSNGRVLRLRYVDGEVVLGARAQDLYGVAQHPAVLEGAAPLRIEVLSPAGRPVQMTADLPGFWKGSWKEVRSEMRSRYPRHDWPADPANASPPSRHKARSGGGK